VRAAAVDEWSRVVLSGEDLPPSAAAAKVLTVETVEYDVELERRRDKKNSRLRRPARDLSDLQIV
jgi:hypothetical protein